MFDWFAQEILLMEKFRNLVITLPDRIFPDRTCTRNQRQKLPVWLLFFYLKKIINQKLVFLCPILSKIGKREFWSKICYRKTEKGMTVRPEGLILNWHPFPHVVSIWRRNEKHWCKLTIQHTTGLSVRQLFFHSS